MTLSNAVRYSCDAIVAALMFWVVFWLYPQTHDSPAYGWAAIKDLVTHPFDPGVWFASLMLATLIGCAAIFTDAYIKKTDVVIGVFITSWMAGLWVVNGLGYNLDHFYPGAVTLVAAVVVTLAVYHFVLRSHPKG